MMWYILFLILTFAVGFFYGHGKPPDDEEQEQETAVDFFRLCEIIEDMNSTKNKLKQNPIIIILLKLKMMIIVLPRKLKRSRQNYALTCLNVLMKLNVYVVTETVTETLKGSECYG